jgi:hypothetical protein
MTLKIKDERPYPVTRLSSEKWAQLPVEWVHFNDLTTTQNGVKLEALLCGSIPYSKDQYPHVVVWEGQHYLEDGHTRMAREVLAGCTGMQCRIYKA